MDDEPLTEDHRRTLRALVSVSGRNGGFVAAKEVADALDRPPSTVRDGMRVLKEWGFVVSKLGPEGGYRPTASTYHALERPVGVPRNEEDRRAPDREAEAVAARTEATSVERADIVDIQDPKRMRLIVHLPAVADEFVVGDSISIGPVSGLRLQIHASIEAVDRRGAVLYTIVEEFGVHSLQPAGRDHIGHQ